MLELSVTPFGIPRMQEKIKKILKPSDLEKVMVRGGFRIEKRAKEHITDVEAVDTGRYRASVSVNWTGSGKTRGDVISPAKAGDGVSKPHKKSGDYMVVRIGTNVEYAVFVHEGTKNMPPRPSLTIAAREGIVALRNDIDRMIRSKKL